MRRTLTTTLAITYGLSPDTLWIVGEPPLFPKGMRFRSQQLARVASQSQEILQGPGFSLTPDEKVGGYEILAPG